jgi:hypothetical protein
MGFKNCSFKIEKLNREKTSGSVIVYLGSLGGRLSSLEPYVFALYDNEICQSRVYIVDFCSLPNASMRVISFHQ